MSVKNRMSILQWRQFGDDDDTVNIRVYPAGDDTDAMEHMLCGYQIDVSDHSEDDPAYFRIWDTDIEDGDLLDGNDGRKYRIRIEEVK